VQPDAGRSTEDPTPVEAPEAKTVAPTSRPVTPPTSRPATKTAEEQLAAAIRPCVRARARLFHLAVRVDRQRAVRRVFLTRHRGVNTAMTECVTEKLTDMQLPLTRTKRGYAEWRVRRQKDGQISMTLFRPLPSPPR
jgi:hypothetical protein